VIVDLAVGDTHESAPSDAARRGHIGGMKGGKARAGALSAAERKAIAKKAAAARWSVKKRA
jgi:hypothetical protein